MTTPHICRSEDLCAEFLDAVGELVERVRRDVATAYPADREGYCEMPRGCGPQAWAILHGVAEAFRDNVCEHCGKEGVKLLEFVHDMVNVKTGKPLHNPTNWDKWVEWITEHKPKQLAFQHDLTAAERTELDFLKEDIRTDPAKRLLPYVRRTGGYKGELIDLTPRQYTELLGRQPTHASINKQGKVPWELAIDQVADEMGFRSDQAMKDAVEALVDKRHRVDVLENKAKEKGVYRWGDTFPFTTFCQAWPDEDCRGLASESGDSSVMAIRNPISWGIYKLGPGEVASPKTLGAEVRYAKDARREIKNLTSVHQEEAVSGLPPAFGWPGGKTRLAPTLLPLIPPHRIYVEPFAGAASLFWAKPRSSVEVLNDLDADVMRFYRHIGDVATCPFPISRGTWNHAHEHQGKQTPCEFLQDTKCSYGDKRMHYVPNFVSHCSMQHLRERLGEYQARLKGVHLHNEDWEQTVRRYDGPDTFFYFDPPYTERANEYVHREDILERMAAVLPKLQGKWQLSQSGAASAHRAFAGYPKQRVGKWYTIANQTAGRPLIGSEYLIANYPLPHQVQHGEEEGTTCRETDDLQGAGGGPVCAPSQAGASLPSAGPSGAESLQGSAHASAAHTQRSDREATMEALSHLMITSLPKTHEVGAPLCADAAGHLLLGDFVQGDSHSVNVPLDCPMGTANVGTFHSHPGGDPHPSEQDLEEAERLGFSVIAVGVPQTGELFLRRLHG